ncbi:hypothetical protein QCA50_008387 [Cerrena zonata]|uniref:Uncharacterized protein n=1 Tax=Cerrena zonata TaxID=2478898 RepID=A0AAW0GDL9_9APHY
MASTPAFSEKYILQNQLPFAVDKLNAHFALPDMASLRYLVTTFALIDDPFVSVRVNADFTPKNPPPVRFYTAPWADLH